jgi:hypothetical protein
LKASQLHAAAVVAMAQAGDSLGMRLLNSTTTESVVRRSLLLLEPAESRLDARTGCEGGVKLRAVLLLLLMRLGFVAESFELTLGAVLERPSGLSSTTGGAIKWSLLSSRRVGASCVLQMSTAAGRAGHAVEGLKTATINTIRT